MVKEKNFGKIPKYGIGDRIEVQEVESYKSYFGIFLCEYYAKFLNRKYFVIEKIERSDNEVIYYPVNSLWRIPEGLIVREVEE